MPKLALRAAADRISFPGLMESAMAQIDGYAIEIERWDVDMDFAFAFQGLPDDRCPASHVGYVVSGKVTIRMADGSEEVFEGGDAYVLHPGHIPSVSAGSEFVTFTPIDEAEAMRPVVQRNMMTFAAEQGLELPDLPG